VFDGWAQDFTDWSVAAPDLLEGLDVATATMQHYVASVVRATRRMAGSGPLVLCGWSMGGLVVLMAAPAVTPDAVVVLEPSLPAELKTEPSGRPSCRRHLRPSQCLRAMA
jgi:alpha-beta hydrolase superfamily lysophospholipase